MNRRNLLAASLLGAPFFPTAAQPRTARGKFTAQTAPDEAARLVLRGRIRDPFRRAGSLTAFAARFSAEFPQLIEQHFAELDADGAAQRFDALSEAELSDIAQLYVNATYEAGSPGLLLPVLATRLSERRLGRLSDHFGFSPVYEWVTRVAPRKSELFLSHAAMDAYGPVPGEQRFGLDGRFAPRRADGVKHKMVYRGGARASRVGLQGLSQLYNKTPVQIYNSFRTAEYGSYSVSAALFESAATMAGFALAGYEVGDWIGTNWVLPLVQTYAPDLYDGIGGTIDMALYNLTEAAVVPGERGASLYYDAQMATASVIKLRREQREAMEKSKGDYAVVKPPPPPPPQPSGGGGSGGGGAGNTGGSSGSGSDGSGGMDDGDYGDPGEFMGP
jgi:hypothetical protein